MFPAAVLLSLELIPAILILGILDDALDEVSGTGACGQTLQRCLLRGIAQELGVIAIALNAQDQALFPQLILGLVPNPDPPGGEIIFQ